MRVRLEEFYCRIYSVITVLLFFCFVFFLLPFLVAELAEYVLKDHQEKQVEDAFGKIYVTKILSLHDSVLTNTCAVLHSQSLNPSRVSVHLVFSSFPLVVVPQDLLGKLSGFLYFCRPFSKRSVSSLTKLLIMLPWP